MTSPFIPCLTCAKPFRTVASLKQHENDTLHFKMPQPGRNLSRKQMFCAYFKAYYENKVMVLRVDRKNSRKIVQREIKNIRKIFEQDDEDDEDDFYSFTVDPAGSTATDTKVHMADEYDFNLIIESEDVEPDDSKQIFFALHGDEKDKYHLKDHWNINPSPRNGKKVPKGYANVRYVRHLQNHQNNNWTHNGFVVPRLVQEHLYEKVVEAVKSNPNINVSCVPHGPAITLRIRPPKNLTTKSYKNIVTHEISVDFAACIKVDKQQIPVTRYGWPRPKTKQCLSEETIQRILDAGVYLVPKVNYFWYISFSNAAKILMRSIDSPLTCRRMCHMILKTDFNAWESEQNFPGISTFIFKNHLFWFNENLNVKDREEYWNDSNIGRCYIELLKDFSTRLLHHNLPNYFNERDNILANKDPDVLRRLSARILERVDELKRIILQY